MTALARDEDAFPTAVLVLAFTFAVIPEVWALVLLFTTAAIEEEAAARAELVFALTADAIPAVAESVCAFTLDVSFAVAAATAVARDDEAEVISDCCAKDPLPRLAPVSVLVPAAQMSAAIEAPEVSERVPADQTEDGMFVIADEMEASVEARFAVPCASDDEAFVMVVLTIAT